MTDKDKPILQLIQTLKDGSVEPSTLTKEQRQQCVEVLVLEGYSTGQIAQLVSKSEKTIKRDIAEIRSRNSLTPSKELMKQLVGDLVMKSEAHQTRLMRLSRSNDGSVSERGQAEFMAWRVVKERTEILQTLGFLALKPQQIVGDIFHHDDSDTPARSLEEVETILAEVKAVAEKSNQQDPKILNGINELASELDRAKLTHKANKLIQQQNELSEEAPNE